MLDLKHYVSHLPAKQAEVIMMHFNKNFKSLSTAAWYFKNIKAEDITWMRNMLNTPTLQDLHTLSDFLKSQEMSFEEKKELVLNTLEKDSPLLAFLEPKGTRSVTVICPKCKGYGANTGRGRQERGWIPKQGLSKAVICQHRTSCGFAGDFIAAYAEEYKLSYGKALNVLADELNIDFTANEVHVGEHKKAPIKHNLVPKVVVEKEINYMSFNPNKPYIEIDFHSYLNKYETMTELQQFKMVATAIYKYSLTTNQQLKIQYYKSNGISARKQPTLIEKVKMIDSKLGCLSKADIAPLVKHLENLFPLEDLIKFGVINDATNKKPFTFKQSVEEALVVIPNFDLYTNMCSGLKYRKTILKSWTDKQGNKVIDKNKEPEFSYGRIANPLPYHLTREALLDKSITFRFFEGQKDLHSMPSRVGVCDIAIPGVNGITVEMMGLFKGRYVELYFDQDKAGQEGAYKLKELLKKAGAFVNIITWNINLGGDVNEVLQNDNIEKINFN